MRESSSSIENRARMDSSKALKGRQRNVWKCPEWDNCQYRDNCAIAMGDNQICGVDNSELLDYLDEIVPIE